MNNEIIRHIIDTIIDQDLESFEDLHHLAFNEDYYVTGCYRANEWLKKHNIDAFEAVTYVLEQEQEQFGEITLKSEDINAERIVNLYVYFRGQELLSEFDLDQSQDALLNDLREALQ